MKIIHENRSSQFFVLSDGVIYQLKWDDSRLTTHIKEIEKEDYEAYLSGKRSSADLMHKAAYGVWPPTKEEKHQSDLEFLKNELQLVHDVSLPNNPKLFEEFPELKSVYEQWLLAK